MITANATPSEVFGQLSTGMPCVITHPRPIAPGWQGDYGETSRVLYPTEQDSLLYTDARGMVPSLMLVIFCDSDCAVHIHPKRVMNMSGPLESVQHAWTENDYIQNALRFRSWNVGSG